VCVKPLGYFPPKFEFVFRGQPFGLKGRRFVANLDQIMVLQVLPVLASARNHFTRCHRAVTGVVRLDIWGADMPPHLHPAAKGEIVIFRDRPNNRFSAATPPAADFI